jgi:pimeloyl-ACP methyl ester carboxylesterase
MRIQTWGKKDPNRAVVCVHGLTRVSDDFSRVAEALADNHWVICPDVAGRGRSDWLSEPSHYHLGQYAHDMHTMAVDLELGPCHWVGTSMGGLIGMLLAGSPSRQSDYPGLALRSLLLNDVGAVINGEALQRIGKYLGANPLIETIPKAEELVRKIFSGFGVLSDSDWSMLTRSVIRPDADGWRFHYDPRIADAFQSSLPDPSATNGDVSLWPLFEAIEIPVLLVRGAQSDLLTDSTAQEMVVRGRSTSLVTLEGVGHAPPLLDAQQVGLVVDWVRSHDQ